MCSTVECINIDGVIKQQVFFNSNLGRVESEHRGRARPEHAGCCHAGVGAGERGGGETARAVEGGVAAGRPGWVAGGPSHARVDGGEAPVQLAGDCGGAARPAARTRQAQLSKNIQIWLWWLFSCAATLYPTPFFFFFFFFFSFFFFVRPWSVVCRFAGSVGDCGQPRGARGAPKPNQNWKSKPNQTTPNSTKPN